MIQIDDLCKNYRNKTALSNVSLQIPYGVYGLIGSKKSGKTTLLKILAALEPFSNGDVAIYEYNLKIQKRQIQSIVGYLPQKFDFFPNMTINEAMSYFFDLKDPKDEAIVKETDIEDCLSYVQLTDEANLKVNQLTPGQKQRLGIAQAFLCDPKFVILDEPTAELDTQERIQFLSLLSKIRDDRIVLMSTSRIKDIKAVCKNFAVLKDGMMQFSGNPEEYAHSLTKEVYSIIIKRELLAQFVKHVNVISLKQVDGKLKLRYMNVADEKIKLNSLSKQVAPTMVDAYAYFTGSWITEERLIR